MASTITAGNATNGLALSCDNTGILELKTGTGAGTTAVTVDASQNVTLATGIAGDFKMNSGYGSVATAYGCRAWVNFNGTGTVAIRASGNVSSITDNGTGDYTVNFTNAMPDANYAVVLPSMMTGGNTSQYFGVSTPSNNSYASKTTSAVRVAVYNTLVSNQDVFDANIAIFR
jgi:uncharacterized protein (AIM24 family)